MKRMVRETGRKRFTGRPGLTSQETDAQGRRGWQRMRIEREKLTSAAAAQFVCWCLSTNAFPASSLTRCLFSFAPFRLSSRPPPPIRSIPASDSNASRIRTHVPRSGKRERQPLTLFSIRVLNLRQTFLPKKGSKGGILFSLSSSRTQSCIPAASSRRPVLLHA